MADITFEEQGLGRGIEQDFVIAEAVALIAAKLDPRDPRNFGPIKWTQEHVNALGRGQAQIQIKIQARRHIGGIDLAVIVIARAETEVAIGQQLRARRVLVAENGDAIADRPGLVHRITPFDRRTRAGHGVLVAVDGKLGVDVIGLVGIARIGTEQFVGDFRSLGLRRHFARRGLLAMGAVGLAIGGFGDARQCGLARCWRATR